MNLALYMRVMRRHRLLVGCGFTLAIVLAFLSMAKVSFGHGVKVSYRSQEIYQAKETLLVSEPGFPWGRSTPTVGDTSKPDPAGAVAAQDRLTSIAVLYAQLANSDPVRRILLRGGFVKRKDITAVPVIQAYSSVGPLLPLVEVDGNGPSPPVAIDVTRRETSAFLQYLRGQQVNANIPPDQRVVVQVLNDPSTAEVVQGRKKTMSILLFMVIAAGTFMTALVRDNLQQSRIAEAAAAEAADVLDLRAVNS